ncbi:MAG: hypothetical protein ACJ790_18005, partial [Myxococcaceae bacterium]
YAVEARDADRNVMAELRRNQAALLGSTDPSGELRASTDVHGCLVAGAYPFAPSSGKPCVPSDGVGEVELHLAAAAWIEGLVTAENGTDMWLVIEEPDGARVATDGSGRFMVGPLTAGEHALEILSPNGKTRLHATATVKAGETGKVQLEAR